MQGEVKWFDNKKGFGFIEPDEGEEDVFVHHTDILMEGYAKLDEGQRVSFEVTQTEKGPKAMEVELLEESESGGNEPPSGFEPGF